MTPSEFLSIAPMFTGEDVMRPALCSPFRHGHHLFASDGRIAIVCDADGIDADFIKETPDENQRNVADRLMKNYVEKIQLRIVVGDYDDFPLGNLTEAVCAAFADVEPEMMWLRANSPDDDDPDADGSPDSVRYVHEVFTSVIMANGQRSVIAGYHASLIAGLSKFYGLVSAYADMCNPNLPLFFQGDNWRCIVMPIYVRAPGFFSSRSIADAKTGALVHSRNDRELNIDFLRFGKGLKGE